MNASTSPKAAGDLLHLDRQVCFPLYAATNLLQRLYRPLLQPLGLTYSQYLVMLLLWEHGSATVGTLRDCLCLDAGTITPLLKRMERDGLITRRRDGGDERRVIIAPTPHAVMLKNKAKRIPATLAARIGMETDDAERLQRMAVELVRQLKPVALNRLAPKKA